MKGEGADGHECSEVFYCSGKFPQPFAAIDFGTKSRPFLSESNKNASTKIAEAKRGKKFRGHSRLTSAAAEICVEI